MASQLIVHLTDDIDPTKTADESRIIGWDGYDYFIDLTKANDEKLFKALKPFLEAAHDRARQPRRKATAKISNSASTNTGKEERDAIRAWARKQGHTVGEKGVIRRELIEEYQAAHGG